MRKFHVLHAFCSIYVPKESKYFHNSLNEIEFSKKKAIKTFFLWFWGQIDRLRFDRKLFDGIDIEVNRMILKIKMRQMSQADRATEFQCTKKNPKCADSSGLNLVLNSFVKISIIARQSLVNMQINVYFIIKYEFFLLLFWVEKN